MRNAFLFLFLLICLAQATKLASQTFVRQHKQEDVNTFTDIAILPNGSYLLIGTGDSTSSGTNYTPLLAIYSSTGQLLKTWTDTNSYLKDIAAVENTNDGGFIIVGRDQALPVFGSPSSIYLAKFDNQANLSWSKNFYHGINGYSLRWANDVVVTSDGGYVLTGTAYTDTLSSYSEAYVMKVDAQGDSLWSLQWGNANNDQALDVINTSDGGLLVSGNTTSQTLDAYPLLLKLTANGSIEWSKIYAEPTFAGPSSLLELPTGNFLMSYSLINEYIMEISSTGDSLTKTEISIGTLVSSLSPTSDNGYVSVGLMFDTSGVFVSLKKLSNDLNVAWVKKFLLINPRAGYAIQLPDKGYLIAGGAGNNAVLIKTDSLGNVPNSTIKGKLVFDSNQNCAIDAGEQGLMSQIIEVAANGQQYFGYTNLVGEYFITAYDTGAATVNWIPMGSYWVQSCQANGVQIQLLENDTVTVDFFQNPLVLCPELNVEVQSTLLRRCNSNNIFTVNYYNIGSYQANNAIIEVVFDNSISVDSASVPWVTPQTGNIYQFEIGDINISDNGSFKIWTTVDCDSTVLGQTLCTEAHIYPDSICLAPDPSWDGASMKLTSKCENDTVVFELKNQGTGDMNGPMYYIIVEDNVMYKQGQFQLLAGQLITEMIPGNGKTYTMIAPQSEGHPGNSRPLKSVEGCGRNNQGTFSLGYTMQYPQDDQNAFVDILCQPIVGSFDPNDKRPEPLGLGAEGYINATQPLDYTIRFQNTGTDTAFLVVLRDTLPQYLDITSLQLTGASHNYTFQIINSNVLEWTFMNIMLPDSNVNEPMSHGYVSFHINQFAGNAVGTEIQNRAGIFFDFNAVVLTNTTLNTIINDYKTWFTFVQSPESKLQLGIFPNPNNGTFSLDFAAKPKASYEFVVYDLAGAKQFGQKLTGTAPYILQPDLPTGMYIYQLLENSVAVGMGKVLINK